MAALFKSRLFTGAIFATALFGAGEQVPVTPQVPLAGGGIYRDISQYNLAKHVKLSGRTWQEQESYGYAGIKYELVAQHKVFAFANTSQEQVSVGSITSTNLVNVYKTDKLVSTVQQSFGKIISNADVYRNVDLLDISAERVQKTAKSIHVTVASIQNQQSVGAITTKQVSIGDNDVSTYYHHIAIGSVHTEQTQESIGVLSVTQQVQSQVSTTTISARTNQQQVSFGNVTTNDDEMLQVLLALMMLDEEIT